MRKWLARLLLGEDMEKLTRAQAALRTLEIMQRIREQHKEYAALVQIPMPENMTEREFEKMLQTRQQENFLRLVALALPEEAGDLIESLYLA